MFIISSLVPAEIWMHRLPNSGRVNPADTSSAVIWVLSIPNQTSVTSVIKHLNKGRNSCNTCLAKKNMMYFLIVIIIVITIEGINLKHESASSQAFRWRLFLVDEFHYLNLTRVGTFTADDDFDCTLKCIRNPLCFSVNLAASKGADGKLWCELLSSDKYRNTKYFKENKSSHHLSIMVGSVFW